MTKLDELVSLLKKAPDEIFLQAHNVPDPDAIASCYALKRLLRVRGIESAIVYEHEIEKANSLKMLDLFGIEMRHSKDIVTLGEEDWAVLVDAQKGNSNITDLATDEVAVIDHHEYSGDHGYRFIDVRPDVGACSSIIASYYFENNVEIPVPIATALLYGIFMDTDNLTRGVSELDVEMFYRLYGLTNITLINQLKGNQITLEDLKEYARAFQNVEVYGQLAFLRLDNSNDSLLGSAGDLVITIAGVNVVVAYSIREGGIRFSIRSINSDIKANLLVRRILRDVGFGGGHEAMAGGFLPAKNIPADRKIDTFIRYRAISFVNG
ncbi:MAG: DHH family phosphoesterase [Spirochaetales bacterium]|nr:DHH family phosphoesterase [Spirochaetales bacterium]